MRKKTAFIRYCFLAFCLFLAVNVKAQFVINKQNSNEKISIHTKAESVDVGQANVNFDQIRNSKQFHFKPMEKANQDFGFTNSNFWFRFSIKNETNSELNYFFETARPITDAADLYIIKQAKSVTKYVRGDAIPFAKRSFKLRKTTFKFNLTPNELQQF